MRAGASLGWRIATAAAFGATAALSVILSRGVPMNAALTSAKGAEAQHATAGAAAAGVTLPCAAAGLRISLGPGARVSTVITRYLLEFTNVSHAACSLAGYPGVSVYRGDGVQVGAAAGRDQSVAADRIVLAPGQTAHAALDAAVPAARCGPVRVTGLRVVAPGQTAARYVRRPLTACTARAPRGGDNLRVRAVQAGAGATAGTAAEVKPLPAPACPARSVRPARSIRSVGPVRPVSLIRLDGPAYPAQPASRPVAGRD